MLIAVLIYLVIGSILMGGIYLANPEIINVDIDDLFSSSNNVNCLIGSIFFLAIEMIWLPVLIAVIIKVIADKFN